MKKTVLFNMMSLDGYFAGPNGELNWHRVDAEFNAFAIDQMQSVDTILFGRKTYELMAGYWPTASAMSDDPIIAGLMNQLPKIVFSTTLHSAGWNNTRVVKENIAEQISTLRQKRGKDLILLGSADLASTLIKFNLIDEVRIMVNPVILGRGRPLFTGIQNKYGLTLLETRHFDSGNMLLVYRTA
jgi:dihydrofolate reductase